jgi:hypothetical protein
MLRSFGINDILNWGSNACALALSARTHAFIRASTVLDIHRKNLKPPVETEAISILEIRYEYNRDTTGL